MGLQLTLLLVLLPRLVWAGCDYRYPNGCRVYFLGGVTLGGNVSQCIEGPAPAPPPPGKQYFYCRAGMGLCSVDSSGVERCLGAVTPSTTTTTSTSTSTTGTTVATTSTTTTTGTTTTTIAGTPLPSWVPSMLAAWMLDETSGTRTNLQGTTARDLSVTDTSDPGSSTDHMEGTRSMSLAGAQAKHSTDTFPSLSSPITQGCWVKPTTAGDGVFMMHDASQVSGTVQLNRRGSGGWQMQTWSGAGYTTTTTNSWPQGVWHHVVGRLVSGTELTIYVDGVQAATSAMGTGASRAGSFYLGDNFNFTGLLDECWVTDTLLAPASICRICSCGLKGELCGCSGASFASTGRNATNCGSCTLPADCQATTPP